MRNYETLYMKRTAIFSLLYGFSVGLFVALTFLLQCFLTVQFGVNRWVMPVMAVVVITLFIHRLRGLLVTLTDKMLYQKRYDYLLTLKNAASSMALVTEVKKLLHLIVHVISKEIRVTGCAIYLFNKTEKCYTKEEMHGFKGMQTLEEIADDSILIQWLFEKRQPLNYSNLLYWIRNERFFPRRMVLKKRLEELRDVMNDMGASLCIPSFLKGHMIGFLVLGAKLSGHRYSKNDTTLLLTLSNNAAIAFENAHMYGELKEKIDKLKQLYQQEHTLFIDAASAFSYAIDTKDGYTHTHTLKVADYGLAITKKLERLMPGVNFDGKFYTNLRIASLLHDVGKIGISDEILKKKERLTQEEAAKLKEHAAIGEKILQPMKEISDVFEVIRHHHEHYDGTGYPDGLKGAQIPLISRIIAVANVYDAMTSDRSYRNAIGKKEATEEIRCKAGKDFDPVVVEAFLGSIGIDS